MINRDTKDGAGQAEGLDAVRREIAARCDAIEQQILTVVATLASMMAETRSLLSDVETRQHVAASLADELRAKLRDVETRQHEAASLADEFKGKFRDVEMRELDLQRTLVGVPELVREIVADEINRMDGYNRYTLGRLMKDLKGAPRG